MFVKEWIGKFPQKYLDVMGKKCSHINCANYKEEGSEECVTCRYGTPKRVSNEDMAVIRKVLGGHLEPEEEAFIQEFNKEV